MTTLSETLEKLKSNLKSNLGNESGYSKNVLSNYSPGNGISTTSREGWTRTQLRFDFENGPDDIDDEEAIDLVIDKLGEDLEDLIENGDSQNTADALLMAIDGAKKRGRQPRAVDVPSAMVIKEYNITRSQFEFTVFCVLYVDWRENDETS